MPRSTKGEKPVVATVLATFFLGLGLGSALAGKWGTRLRRPARVYALLEIAIGAWAILSLLLIPNVHDVYAAIGGGVGFGLLTVLRFLIAVLILLPPTLLMGATLPVLVAVVARRGVEWSSGATWLYATNTFGAVLGAGATGLYLVPAYGARVSIVIAAVTSFAAALLVYALWRTSEAEQLDSDTDSGADAAGDPAAQCAEDEAGDGEAAPAAPEYPAVETHSEPPAESPTGADALEERAGLVRPSVAPPTKVVPSRVRLAMTLACIAGFASLASEVLWTRVLRLVVQGTTQAFAAMLVNYLVGIALGSLIAERLMRKSHNPTKLFAITQLLLAVFTAIAIWVGSQLPRLSVLIQESTTIVPHEAWVILAISAFLLLPLALILGTSVPLAWRIAGGGADDAASHSGKILAANTLGGLGGSLCAGFALIPGFALALEGTDPAEIRVTAVELSLVFVLFVHLLAATVALRSIAWNLPSKVFGMTAPVALGIALVALGPSLNVPFLLDSWYDPNRALIYGPDDSLRDTVVFLREGRNTTVSVLERDATLRLFNDGRPESGFGPDAPGFGEELAVLGSLPTLFAEEHERAMVIGLGAGHTTAVMLGGPWEHLDVVELEGAVVEAARFLYEEHDTPFPLDDERAHLIVDDARAQLVLADEDTYDAVVSQPSHPWLAGSSALYTQEFFREVDRALKPGGVLSLWTNLFRIDIPHLKSIVHTLLEVFDHVSAFVVESSSFILIAGHQPAALDAHVAELLASDGLSPYLRPFALDDIVDFSATLELDSEGTRAWAADAPLIVDDRPVLEFDLARIPHDQDLSEVELDEALLPVPWLSRARYETLPADVRMDFLVQRIDYTQFRWRARRRLEASLESLGLSEGDEHLIRGVLAETAGNVTGALGHYDQVMTDDRASYRADVLREAEHLDRSLIRSMNVPDRVQPHAAEPFLVAALRLEDREAARGALTLVEPINDTSDTAIAAVVEAWLADDCEAVLAAVEEHPRALDVAEGALEAAHCAYAKHDEEQGLRFMRDYHRNVRATAAVAARDGNEARNGGNNGLALRYYRRALNAYPAHAVSASTLARMLNHIGYSEQAAEVVRTAHEGVRGLPSASETIRNVAAELEIDL